YNSLILTNNKFREWSTSVFSSHTNPEYIRIENYDPVIAHFYPTQPLTVTNNLEGGNGGTYKVTWDKKSNETQTINSGQSYYAFEYNQALQDVFTLEVQDLSALNTSWFFRNWENGNNSKSRIEAITANNKNFTAIYKGHFRSDNSSAYTSNSQQKIIRDINGYYHTVYSSMGNVYYTYSLTTDFNGNWSQEEWIGENAKNPSIDFYGNNIVIVLEYSLSNTSVISKIKYAWNVIEDKYLIESQEDVAFYPISSFGGAKPVVAYTNGEIYVAYKESASSPLKYWRTYQDGIGQWHTQTGNIPYTTANSFNVTLASKDSQNDIYIAWQERTTTGTANSIKYLYSSLSGTVRSYSSASLSTISSKSGFIHNINPSISIYSTNNPIES
ncbi:MAG: hypothetical protein Q8M94_05300, partial [Ignavibacteria bacterium]|nr:hypothetical protein [Ignavibacteria bacterium]